MPTVSRFLGISILIFYLDAGEHNLPHLHARYGGAEAVFSIPDGEILAGSLPKRQARAVQTWMLLRERELNEAWSRAVVGEPPGPISPLR